MKKENDNLHKIGVDLGTDSRVRWKLADMQDDGTDRFCTQVEASELREYATRVYDMEKTIKESVTHILGLIEELNNGIARASPHVQDVLGGIKATTCVIYKDLTGEYWEKKDGIQHQ